MKKYLILTLGMLISGLAFGQLSGTYTIPGDYVTIQAAISALNSQGVGSGGVTFDVDADHTETLSSVTSGYITTLTSSAANPIVFQKAGGGANPVITAAVIGTATTYDGIIKIGGADYVTFDGIDLAENPANTTNRTDWGYAVLMASATNASQNIVIKNCTITLNKANTTSIGIYSKNHNVSSTTTITPTATSGVVNNCDVDNCYITNCYIGIQWNGYSASSPYTLYGQNNRFGYNAGNTITNFGGSSVGPYGIYAIYQNNIKVANNTIDGGTGTTTTLYGIYLSLGTNSNVDIVNNTVSITGAGTTSSKYGIGNAMGSTGTNNMVTISGNIVENCTYPTATSGAFYGISQNASSKDANVYDNVVRNNTKSGTGTFYGIYTLGSVVTNELIYNNQVYGNTNTGAASSFYCIYSNPTSTTIKQIYNNVVYNNINNGGSLYGIATATGNTINIYKNKVYDLSNNAAAGITHGLYVTSGTTVNLFNNFVSDLKAPAATSTNAVNGLYVSGGTNVNAYYNTIYLAATSSGSTFGTSGIYTSVTPTVDLRNNIVVNKSVPGASAYSAAYRRSSNTLTTYSTNSNNNCFYQEPGTNCVVYAEGTAWPVVSPNVVKLTLADYKSYMATRDQASFSEEPPFVDVSATPYDLHIAAGTATQCESGGITISSPAITTDYDGDNRYPNTPYPDDPGFPATAPDVGADEFAGEPQDLTPPSISYTALPNTALFGDRTLTATITDPSGVPTSGGGLPTLYWKINSGAYTDVQGVSIGSNQYTFTFGTGVIAGDIVSYYICAQDESPAQNAGAFPSAGAAGFSVDPPACSTPPTSPSTYTIVPGISGAVSVGTGGTYTSLTGTGGLFADINSKVVTGNITATIISDLTEDGSNALNQTIEDGAGGYTITIQPDGTTPRIISGTYTGGLIRLNGADRVIFDGRYSGAGNYLTFQNSTTSTNSAVFQLISLGAGQGATDNTIRNCNIIGGSNSVTSFFDIYIGSASISTTGTGADNNNNTIQENVLTKAYFGIYARGVASTGLLTGLVISGNTIGSDVATDYITYMGVSLQNATAPQIIANHIFNLQVSTSVNNVSVDLGQYVTDALVAGNEIHGMRSTSTSGYGCYGICISSSNGTSNIQMRNNMIYDLINDGDGTSTTYNPFGIRITGGTDHKVYNNSINLSGSFLSVATADISAAIVITSSTATGLDIRNNIFANNMTGGSGSKAYAIYAVSGTVFGTIDYNDYYASGSFGILGYYGSDISTINDWKVSSGQDALSYVYQPEFTSSTNLHINSGLTPTRLESTGQIIAAFSDDIDGDHRPGPTGSVNGGAFSYDMGADEFDGVPAPVMSFVSSDVTQTDVSYVLTNSTDNQVIGIEVVTTGMLNPLEITQLTLNTTGTTDPANDIANAKIYYTGTSSTFATTSQFGTTVAAPSGSYNVTGSQLLSSGTNYFWLTYDVTAGATSTNVIDAECTSVKVDAVDHTPTHTAPTGSREILGSLSGIYTVGTVGDFYTLYSAFAAANQVGLSGNVTFNIISDITETSMAVLNQWTETPSGSNYTMLIQPSGGAWTVDGSITSALIKLYGADRVTIDGLNTGGNSLTLKNNSTSTLTSVIWLSSLGAGQGATNNTIKNCTITGGSSTVTSFFDVFMGGTSVSTSGTGADNNNNTIESNVLTKAYYGIYARGVTSTGELTGLNIVGNTIGSSGSDIIGAYGMSLQAINGATISGNDIFGINANNSRYGIYLGTYVSNSVISKNKIHGLTQSGTTSTYYCIGIYFSSATSVANNEISNNAIYDLYNYGSTTNNYGPIGIRLVGGDGHKIYFNSISLTGAFGSSTSGVFSHCLMISTAATNMDIRNNIFYNTMTGTTPKTYTVYNTAASGFATIDYNDYYTTSPTYFGYYAADVADFSAWQTATTQDGNSLNADPMYNGTTNLQPQDGSPVLGVGTTIVTVTEDILGVVRNDPPSMGAYEEAKDAEPPIITYTALTNTTSTADRTLTATITDFSGVPTSGSGLPVLYWNVNGGAYTAVTSVSLGANQYEFTFGSGVSTGDVINYYVVAQDMAPDVNVGANPSAGATGFTSDPPACSTPPSTPNTYNIMYTISGNKTVGTGGDYPSLTGAGGLFADINAKIVTGNITATVISDLTETGANALNQINEEGVGGYIITIQPDGTTPRIISGTYTGGLIRLNGADRVTFDGRFSGSGNYLTFQNNGTSTNSAVFQLISLGAGAGATNNTIRNCTISGGSNTVSSFFDIFLGSASISTSGTGADNNDNSIIDNVLTKSYYGIYARGVASTGLLTGLVISGNTIGADVATDYVTYMGVTIQNATAPEISNNHIYNLQVSTSLTNVSIDLGQNVTNALVNANEIHGMRSTSTSGYGCYGINISSSTGTSNIQIVNNVIYDLINDGDGTSTTYNPFGIRITGGTDHKVYYNSVNLYGSFINATTADYSAALLITSSSATGLDIRDNIFVNSMTGGSSSKCFAVYAVTGTTFGTIDYNDYYVSGTNGVFGYLGADIADLAAWKGATSQDASSISADPLFTSNSNLLPQSGSPLISAATPIAGVTTDIDGVTRHATLPTIGAYEIVLPPCAGAVGGTATANGTDTYCGSGTPNITCSGYSTGDISTYQWQYSNDNFVADINDFTGQTNPAALTTGVVSATNYYRLKVTCNSGLATDYSNVITITIKPVPTASASSNSPICAGSNLNLTGTTDIGTTFAWTGPNSFTSSDQNPTITAATTAASGTYSFIATLNGCSSAAGTTSVTVNPVPASVTATASSNTICSGSTVNLFSSSTNSFTNTYLSPTGDGGFETGSTFVLNNWTVVNGTYNQWFVGTAAGVQAGTNAAYSGTNFVGTANSSVNHFYRDIAIPAGATSISLAFYLKMPIIDNTYDYINVYTTTTANTPIAGTLPTTGYTSVFSNTATAYANYTLQTIALPDALAGTSVRFVFTYKCDGASPYAVSALDNISLTAVISSSATYSWTSDPAGFTSTDQNPANVTPNATTDYLVTVQNSYNCTASASTNVVVDNPSSGGTITPSSATINGGQSTGNLDLSSYTGSIVKWQRNFALMGWSDIPSTAGLTTYSEVPSSSGSWQYRAVVQNGVCAEAYSSVSTITVNTLGLTTFSGVVDSDWNTAGNWDNGVPGAYLNAYIPANKLVEVNTASSKCYNLTIEPLGMLTVNNGSDLQVAGTMTVQASATGMGSVIDNGTLTTGSNLIQRWVSTNGTSRWEYVSAPVAAASSSLFTNSTRSLWYADETLNAWASITNASPANLNLMKGYARKYVQSEGDGNTTVNFTGSLNTGAKSIALTRTESAPGAQHGWNLVGNPYPSTMDWDAVSGWTKTNVDDGIYFRTNGNFASYVAGVGTNGGTKYIPPMQAFWVRVTAGQTTGTLGSNQSVRVHHDHNIYKSYPALDNNLSLTVTNMNNNMSDETYLRFGSYATDGFDGAYDAYKMTGADSIYPQIYTNIDGTDDLSINSRNTLLGELIIPLGFTTFVAGQFTFNADMVSTFTSNGNTVYLKDLFTGNTQNLALNNAYQFTSGIAGGLNRFVLHFNPATVSINEVTGNTIQIYSHKNEIFISGDEILDGEVYIYDMPGKLVLSQKISGVKNTSVILNTAGGVYIVKYISAEESSARRVYINQ